MMMTFKRILSAGATSFTRSGLVSFATVLIMTVTLIIIGALVLLSAVLTNTLTSIQNKVDVNVYFATTAEESQVLAVKTRLEQRPEVDEVTYTSRDQSLLTFREKHQDDVLTLQALDQLGDNPLGASLAVKAKDPTLYAAVVQFLTDDTAASSIIDRINYAQNKVVIERLSNAIDATQRAGLAIVILFVIASIIIALATVRLAIYSARDEISVMRLVGASNMYIRGPFIVAGVIAGLISGLIALAFFFPVTWYAGYAFSTWLGGFNLFTYYVVNFPFLFMVVVGSGLVLGSIASFLGVRRYLQV
ncbi:MAG: cell division transport system permease protein [Parcubacteria bacterium C7867-008]|nr:MAG: cell division transport system permease protein [Parcubacteria bacterium C7867-008]